MSQAVSDASAMTVPPPRIVLATDKLSPGGVSHFVLQLATNFRSKGYQVDVVALRPGEWDHRLVDSGVVVHTLPHPKVVDLIRAADVVHCQQRILGLLAILLGARHRTIEHVHNVMSGHRWLSFRAPRIIAVSDQVRTDLQKNYPRLSGRPVTVVRNGAQKRPGEPLPFVDRCHDVLGVGRLEEQKDPLAFLDLVAELRRHHTELRAIWLAPGDGSLRPQFLDHRDRLGLGDTVELILGGSHDQARDQIARAKVLLMTSKWEGLPLVALEALASGTPVATTPCGEIAEIIADSNCGAVLSSVPDVDTSALLPLVTEPRSWAVFSTNAFRAADGFSEDGMVAVIEQVYASVNPCRWPSHPADSGIAHPAQLPGGLPCES